MDLGSKRIADSRHRRLFIGGSDARIVMGERQTPAAPLPSQTQRVRQPGLRSRTPCPPPFSSMNSTPADLIAPIIRSEVSPRPPKRPSTASRRLMVGIDTSAAFAKSSCDQPSSARAALTWRIDTFSIDFSFMLIDTFSIEHRPNRREVGSQ